MSQLRDNVSIFKSVFLVIDVLIDTIISTHLSEVSLVLNIS